MSTGIMSYKSESSDMGTIANHVIEYPNLEKGTKHICEWLDN